jgi:phospholipid transport system transporter-binding protein
MNAMRHTELALALPERLTVTEAPQALMRFESELTRHPEAEVVVNIGSLKTFDSSALAFLLALRRRQHARGKVLRVNGWPQRLNDLAVAYGVRDLFAAGVDFRPSGAPFREPCQEACMALPPRGNVPLIPVDHGAHEGYR